VSGLAGATIVGEAVSAAVVGVDQVQAAAHQEAVDASDAEGRFVLNGG
jgi:hypothetical protein